MTLVGRASAEQPLTDSEIREICAEALAAVPLDGCRVLMLIPDHTRHARMDLFFRVLCELLEGRATTLDVLIATGTHADMEVSRILRHVGITWQEHLTKYRWVNFFNHAHANPHALAELGTIPSDEISRLSGGVLTDPLTVTVNRKVLEYDHILIVSPVVPHETMGFAGGNKYFFPGISGREVVETFHWLGAVLTNMAVNGVKETPTRRIINRAAELIPTPRTCLAFAVNEHHDPMCLFVGDPVEAWSHAADVSARLHITYVDRPYRTILAVTPPLYEELWVGGKAMYKLEPVVADGGELIIYGPQIRAISFVHEEEIRRIGYHVIEYFTKQWRRFAYEPKLILAHSTNVRGNGTFAEGIERPRVTVTLATGIPEAVCRQVNLGYRDHRGIDVERWRSRREEDVLVVDNAGQNLYRLADSGGQSITGSRRQA